jgi:hypothetical protein
MYSHCIIGSGTAGLLLLLLLAEKGINLQSIVIIDPYFDGGDLRRKWAQVISNTPWSKTYEILKNSLPSLKMPLWANELPLDQITPLSQIIGLIHELALPILSKIRCIQGTVKRLESSDSTPWEVQILRESEIIKIHSTNIYLTVGAEQKRLDLSVPSIPLEIALDSARLRHYIKPTDRVILFGTAHSGTLILKNLADLSIQTTAVYRSAQPFLFARDNVYDGIKADAAVYADDITNGKYPTLNLVPATLISSVFRETRSANWAIYATGFEPRNTIEIYVNGNKKSAVQYSPITGKITDCPNAWGFGIAYPSQAPDGIHFDVGVTSFIEHINSALSLNS